MKIEYVHALIILVWLSGAGVGFASCAWLLGRKLRVTP